MNLSALLAIILMGNDIYPRRLNFIYHGGMMAHRLPQIVVAFMGFYNDIFKLNKIARIDAFRFVIDFASIFIAAIPLGMQGVKRFSGQIPAFSAANFFIDFALDIGQDLAVERRNIITWSGYVWSRFKRLICLDR